MLYQLMHKDIEVADIELDENGEIKKLIRVINVDHFPFGTAPKEGRLNPSGLKRWWKNRRIPYTRDEIGLLSKAYPDEMPLSKLLLACKGHSLSDCYWIREGSSQESFSDFNFFENGFRLDLGDALMGKPATGCVSFLSPDASSEGNLKKRWKIINGKRTLLKAGTPPHQYEIFNEVIASEVMSYFGIPHVDYYLYVENGELYSACEDFVGYSQDFVTAYMIYEAGGKRNDESDYAFLLRRYKELGIENAEIALQQMLLVDYLLGNEDRHLNNFGLLRDAKTLRFLGVAPVFDTGSSLCFTKNDEALIFSSPSSWKPFATRNKPSQLDYIPSLPGILPDVLLLFPQAVHAACASFGDRLSAKRKRAIMVFVQIRLGEVMKRYGVTIESLASSLNLTQSRIVEYIRSTGGKLYSAEELASALDISRITAIRNLQTLVTIGTLRRVGSKKTGFWELIAI